MRQNRHIPPAYPLILVGAAHDPNEIRPLLAHHQIVRDRAPPIAVDFDDDVGDVMLALRPFAFQRHDTAKHLLDRLRALGLAVVGGPHRVIGEQARDLRKPAGIERMTISRHHLADRILVFEHRHSRHLGCGRSSADSALHFLRQPVRRTGQARWIEGGHAARGRGRQDARPPQSATGAEIASLAHAEQADLEQAAAAAERGFRAWRDVAAFERSKIMRKAAELLRSYADAIARLLTQEEGKTLVEAKGEVMAGANIIDWFGEPELLARYRTHAPCIVR